MKTMTDNELKQLLAAMLPDTVEHFEPDKLLWRKPIGTDGALFRSFVLDTELLHLCALADAGLDDAEWVTFTSHLNDIVLRDDLGFEPRKFEGIFVPTKMSRHYSATWQQRTEALAKVKGLL